MLLNSPHNPTGRVLDRAELELIAAACVEHDLICVTDEVYEHLVYDGEHIPLATLPGMAERTLTISSVGKSFSFTGWKIGWCSGPARAGRGDPDGQAVPDVRRRHAAAARRRRRAAAAALGGGGHPRRAADQARPAVRRDSTPRACARSCPAGTYFVNADVGDDAVAFCAALPERCGVVAIPTSVFYDDKEAGADARAVRVLQAPRGDRRGRFTARRPSLTPGRIPPA